MWCQASQLRRRLDESKASSGKHSVDSLCLMRRLVHVLAAQEEDLGEAAAVQRSLIGTLELLDPLPALALAGALLDLAALVLREGNVGAAGAAITRCLDLLEDEVVGPSEGATGPGTVDIALGAADAESVRVRAYGLRASVHARCGAAARSSAAPLRSHRRAHPLCGRAHDEAATAEAVQRQLEAMAAGDTPTVDVVDSEPEAGLGEGAGPSVGMSWAQFRQSRSQSLPGSEPVPLG